MSNSGGELAQKTKHPGKLDSPANTTISTFDAVGSQTLLEVPVPAVTILLHPDMKRVGERALLSDLSSGFPVSIARYGPTFVGVSKGNSQALLDPRVSRRPLWINVEGEEVVLTAEERSRIKVDGRKLKTTLRYPVNKLGTGGLCISMGSGVLLWLHLAVGSQPKMSWHQLFGISRKAHLLRSKIQAAANGSGLVTVRGGEGCEHDQVVRAIHDCSRRRKKPFVKQFVGKLPQRGVVEELFGSPAGGSSRGAVRDANGGTLFLYDIGHASADVQSRLELFLSGENRGRNSDVRIIAGSRLPLEKLVREGRFSHPLLCRLQTSEIQIPPLSGRPVDIAVHLYHYLAEALKTIGKGHRLSEDPSPKRPWLSSDFVLSLMNYDYPRNQEELRGFADEIVRFSHNSDKAALPPALAVIFRKSPVVRPSRSLKKPEKKSMDSEHPTLRFES